MPNSLVIVLASAGMLYIAYKVYGTFLARKILSLQTKHVTPAVEQEDGRDFVPTRKAVLFGHHFASIAGLAPIAGPAIAVVWGWLPALLWVIFGSIFVGAVHDMGTLAASIRHKAATIGDVTREMIGPRAQVLFLIMSFFLLALAMGVFALLMAKLFTNLSPEAVVPTFSLIFVAIVIGTVVYKMKWRLLPVTVVGLVVMFALLFVGAKLPVPAYRVFVTDAYAKAQIAEHASEPAWTKGEATEKALRDQAKDKEGPDAAKATAAADDVAKAVATTRSSWTYTLLVYAFIASILPVWLLLQPRDYINSFLLYAGLLLMVVGFVVWRPALHAPALNLGAEAKGQNWLPFLFITIACGAVSGFHNLVSSGTTARQLRREPDALPVGFGGMLTEAFLAVLVIVACASAMPMDSYEAIYGAGVTRPDAPGLGGFLTAASRVIAEPFNRMVSADADKAADITAFCKVFISVVVVSFAMTTLDSGTRLLRYNVESLTKLLGRAPARLLGNRYVASLLAVAAIGFIALLKLPDSTGTPQPAGITLWTLFGTTNQILAALGLLIVSIYLWIRRKPIVFTIVPMVALLAMVTWAMVCKIGGFYAGYAKHNDSNNMTLLVLSSAILLIAFWVVLEAILAFRRPRPDMDQIPMPETDETLEA